MPLLSFIHASPPTALPAFLPTPVPIADGLDGGGGDGSKLRLVKSAAGDAIRSFAQIGEMDVAATAGVRCR